MDNDYLNEIDDIEIPDELSYQFIQQGIQKKVMRKWKALKRHIAENTQTDEEINEFEKLLNYFYCNE